jgi:glycine/D-amino acid oxidase-like deaminating enzyme
VTSRDTRRVAVVGGGILGASTAASLARHGAKVTLFTEGRFASGASGRSLAWLNSHDRWSAEYRNLRLLGLDRYRTFASRVEGASSYLRFDGGLTWHAPGKLEDRRHAFEHMRRVGYAAQWVSAEEVAQLTPGVDPTAISPEGAIFNPQEGWVELPRLVSHLVDQLLALAGDVRPGSGRCQITVRGGSVTGVRTGTGEELPFDNAVLATGPDVPRTLAEHGIDLPDASTVPLLIRTRPFDTSLRAVLNTPRVAVRPTPEGGVVCDAAWTDREVVTGADGTFQVPEETLQGLLEETSAVLDGHPSLTYESYGVGLKPIPGDGDPVLGFLEEVDGYHVAFTHSGATLGLIAGELIADEVVHDAPHPLLDPFRPSRFANRKGASEAW